MQVVEVLVRRRSAVGGEASADLPLRGGSSAAELGPLEQLMDDRPPRLRIEPAAPRAAGGEVSGLWQAEDPI